MSFSNNKQLEQKCPHGILLESTCWGCAYIKNHGSIMCYHNKIENDCYECVAQKTQQDIFKYHRNNKNNPNNLQQTFQSSIPLNNYFNNESKKENKSNFNIRDINDFCENQLLQSKEYLNPNNTNTLYPNVINEWKNENINIAENNCREQNNRTKMGNINSFMERSLQTINFIDNNNSKNIWSNPISNNSFPNFHLSDGNTLDNDETTYLGISTRNTRKLDDHDLHLKRSMLQPDFRQGNRFYEIKPTNTRRENYRGIGNENARKFQTQTEEMFKDMNWSKSYDIAAGINRG